jgi:hypothetical protein
MQSGGVRERTHLWSSTGGARDAGRASSSSLVGARRAAPWRTTEKRRARRRRGPSFSVLLACPFSPHTPSHSNKALCTLPSLLHLPRKPILAENTQKKQKRRSEGVFSNTCVRPSLSPLPHGEHELRERRRARRSAGFLRLAQSSGQAQVQGGNPTTKEEREKRERKRGREREREERGETH